jgi:ABC-type polysaccharide/polyol phosphate transport system ATPase subunit
MTSSKKNNDFAIKLTNVSKKYKIHHEKPTLVEHLIKGKHEEFWALKDINLTIRKGEKIGIIGPNGSGKTTLLKIIAGITSPTSGSIQTNGKIVSLIDLEAGFHPDLTGYQNIFLNGMLLGMKKDEIESKLQAIISFADIGKFIDIPIYTYSSGMQLRLGFAISIFANPDVLILDENVSAGDENFQKKSLAKIQEFFKIGKTIILVSHWLAYIRKNCKRVILIENHTLKNDGGASVISRYLKV